MTTGVSIDKIFDSVNSTERINNFGLVDPIGIIKLERKRNPPPK